MKTFEVTISQGGHEIRLPPLAEGDAYSLASMLNMLYPNHLIEVCHDGLRRSL